jgi:hypothetical protein
VDWSFLDRDDGKPGDPPQWVLKSIELMKEMGEEDESVQKVIADMVHQHQWTRPIIPPITPKHFHPDEDEGDEEDEG